MRPRKPVLRPGQMIVLSFLLAAGVGALLLMTPVAGEHDRLAPLDALFMSVSAVCVTGLATVNTGADLSCTGHWILLLLIQIGGLNYMVISTAFMVLMGQRIALARRMLLRTAMGHEDLGSVVDLWRAVIYYTVIFEGIGAVILSLVFCFRYGAPFGVACKLGLFHSVSAFCNAGLDLFGRPEYGQWFGAPGGANSLFPFRTDLLVQFTVAALIIIGGLGFVVLSDLFHRSAGRRRLGTHTRIVLATTGLLLVGGWLAFWLIETGNPQTLGPLNWLQQGVAAFFESVTARTAGFSTISQSAMLPASKLLVINLMVIGASPGGTGGGVKTTTFVIVLLAVLASVRGEDDVNVAGRRISHGTIYRALSVLMLGIVIVAALTFFFTLSEVRVHGTPLVANALRAEEHGLLINYLFEAASAFGTVGLSCGITAGLTTASKLGLIVTMLLGRIGPVTLAASLAGRHRRQMRKFPEGGVMIG